MEKNQPSVIVVGAGIIGAATGFELQRRGFSVTLLDAGAPGKGASFGNMASIALDFAAGSGPATWRKLPGWLMDPQGPVWLRPGYAPKILPWFLRFAAAGRAARLEQIEAAGMAMSALALGDFRTMLEELGLPGFLTENGCLAIYETDAEFTGDRDHLQLMRRFNFNFQVLSGPEVQEHEPTLSSKIEKAVLLPNNKSVTDPYRLVLSLVEAVRNRGGDFVSGEARTVEKDGSGRMAVVLADGRRLEADQVVLAVGVRTRFIAERLGEPIPLETERGYHTQIMRPGIGMRYSIIWPRRAFMITPTAGGVRVGGNVELAGLDAPPDYRRARVLVRHAQRVLPGLTVEGTTEWMGHRPALPDTIPIISPSSRLPGVWYATGHGHLGLTYAATTARLIAEMMTGVQSALDTKPFRIDRY